VEQDDEGTEVTEDALFGGCGPDRLIANAPPDKRAILERAAKWIRDPVPYSQTAYKDGHRTDCSGFVSMAWGRSDFTTHQVPPRSSSTAIAREIPWDDLEVGDAVARGPTIVSSDGHIMLYAGTDYLGFACFWEQTKPQTRIASFLKTSLTGEYVAIRKR
jgi:hypothetical protein